MGEDRWDAQSVSRRTLPLAPLTTLRLGGDAERAFELVDPGHVPELARIVAEAGAGAPDSPVAIGGGSNVLVADSGVTAPVILLRTRGVAYSRPDPDGPVLVTVQAGHPWPDLARELVAQGLVGMEMMTGIPGTVGAMPVQNVGAYGQETADRLVSVDAWDWQRSRLVTLTGTDCRLGHRDSMFKRSRRWLILNVTFALTHGSMSAPVTYRQVAEVLDVPLGARVPTVDAIGAVEKVRASKGMLLEAAGTDDRSVGSVFLSPRIPAERAAPLRAAHAPVHDFADGSTRVSASWLMRDAGLALGEFLAPGIRISTRHYTLVVDDPSGEAATAAGFVDAARQVQDRVLQATGVWLTPEPDAVGDLPAYQHLLDRTRDAAEPS
jgi:UDP-N-acetylmuramate dehydrogenase